MTQEHDGDMEQIRARVHVALHPEFGPEAYTSEGKNFVIRALAKDVRYLLEREASPGSPAERELLDEAFDLFTVMKPHVPEWQKRLGIWRRAMEDRSADSNGDDA